jgi:hypothetical protein
VEPTHKPYNKGFVVSILKIAGAVLAPAILFILPIDFFDSGQSICLSKVLLDMDCYACGITRAGMHLIHFDFNGAYEFNPLIYLVAPVAAIGIGFDLKPDFIRILNFFKQRVEKE